MFQPFRNIFGGGSSIFYQPVDNPALVTSFGVLIARGIIRKENAREILIEVGIFKSIDVSKQTLHIPLSKEVILNAREWKSPNDAIYKMGGAWWMNEAALRCDLLSAFFTGDEQRAITEKIQKTRTSPPLDPAYMDPV